MAKSSILTGGNRSSCYAGKFIRFIPIKLPKPESHPYVPREYICDLRFTIRDLFLRFIFGQILEVKQYIPHPALQNFVLHISTVHVILPAGIKEVVSPYPPTPFQSLLFYCNDPVAMGRSVEGAFDEQPLTVLVGPQYSRVNVKVFNQLRAVRVDFMPGGLFRLLGIPMHEMFDQGYDALDVFGREMKDMNRKLQETGDLRTSKELVEDFLLYQLKRVRALLPIDFALHTLLNHNGQMTMDQVASLSCLSIKQFERNCLERIGMTPKLYARILRFSKAYRMHEALPGMSWIKIAYEAGYYDQMHMIKDFRVFAGVNPTEISRDLRATPLRMQKDLGG